MFERHIVELDIAVFTIHIIAVFTECIVNVICVYSTMQKEYGKDKGYQ